jgi:ABC-type ATPase with predicted acetyltransferase domain
VRICRGPCFVYWQRRWPVLQKKHSPYQEADMAVFTCDKCGSQVDTRCKPGKCPQCGEKGVMCKVEAPKPPKPAKSK